MKTNNPIKITCFQQFCSSAVIFYSYKLQLYLLNTKKMSTFSDFFSTVLLKANFKFFIELDAYELKS